MWWIKWCWGRFLSQYFHYHISVSFPQCSVLTIILIQLKRGQVLEASSLQKKWCTLGCYGTLVSKILSLYFLCLKEWNCGIVVRVECIWILWQRIQSVFYGKLCIYRSPWDTCTDRKLYNIDKFDASFFGIHNKEAESMDPQCRMLLEKTYEAIVDAG
jgi:hypothetical protein